MKDWFERHLEQIAFVVIMAIILAIALGIVEIMHNGDVQVYNNGICSECGGHWHLVHNTVYECDTCYKTFIAAYPLK